MKVWRAILLATCFFSLQAWAQTSVPVKISTVPSKTVTESSINPSDWKKQPEAIALEEQNKIFKQYHSALTDTVYFALSLVGGVAALLVGASFLINFKLYESDKERISEKLTGLKSELDEVRKSQADVAVALRTELEATILAQTERSKAQSLASVQTQLDSFANRASNEMIGLRAEVSSIAENNEKRLEIIRQKLDGFQISMANLEKTIAHVESIAHEAEAEAFEAREYSGSKLIALSQALGAAVKSAKAWNVQLILGSLEETLSELTDEKKKSITDEALDLVKRYVRDALKIASESSSKVLEMVAEIEEFRKASSA